MAALNPHRKTHTDTQRDTKKAKKTKPPKPQSRANNTKQGEQRPDKDKRQRHKRKPQTPHRSPKTATPGGGRGGGESGFNDLPYTPTDWLEFHGQVGINKQTLVRHSTAVTDGKGDEAHKPLFAQLPGNPELVPTPVPRRESPWAGGGLP